MTNIHQPSSLLREKVTLETGQIPWRDLQRFFAKGTAISIAPELDLVEVAYAFSSDQKTHVEQWVSTNQVEKVTDQQALRWYDKDMMVWAVIVKPWVLVQIVEG